ncbi:hypothetical protein B4N84_14375 [Flavobacterium sp. IR1]|nr:hypothetical protein B4N84_14375 [Flavobacterium sp. IR1]
MTKIRVLEANVSGNKHSMFNASFLKMLSILRLRGELIFYSEKAHQECVQNFLREDVDNKIDDITFLTINIVDRGRFYLPIKFLFEIYNVSRFLFKFRKEDYLLILTSISQAPNFFIKLIKIFFPKTKMLFVIHGELEFLKKHDEQPVMLKIWGWFLKYSFKIKTDSNTFYLVLGDVIKTNMRKYDIIDLRKVLSIDHPCLYNGHQKLLNNDSLLKIGAIGVASEQKKSQYIFDIGDKIIAKDKQDIQIEIIGKILPNLYKYLRSGVIYSKENVMLDQKSFDEKISSLDFSLFFYDNTYYELCASGAFFDALNHEIPMLGLKNDFFEYYFEKYGPMGYLFDDVEDLIDFLINYNKSDDDKYNSFVKNIRFAKEKLAINNLAVDFQKILIENRLLSSNKISNILQ